MGASRLAREDNSCRYSGIFLPKRFHDLQSRITSVTSAKYQFETGILLPIEALQILLHKGFHPTQRLQDGHWRQRHLALTRGGWLRKCKAQAKSRNQRQQQIDSGR